MTVTVTRRESSHLPHTTGWTTSLETNIRSGILLLPMSYATWPMPRVPCHAVCLMPRAPFCQVSLVVQSSAVKLLRASREEFFARGDRLQTTPRHHPSKLIWFTSTLFQIDVAHFGEVLPYPTGKVWT